MIRPLFISLLLLTVTLCYGQSADTASILLTDPIGVAVNNGFFPPARVLQYKKELSLTAPQITRLNEINRTLALKKTETGISTRRNEHMLDSMFRYRRLNEGTIIFYTNRYGLYEGEYRGALLMACYNTRKVLTPAQVAKLGQLQKP